MITSDHIPSRASCAPIDQVDGLDTMVPGGGGPGYLENAWNFPCFSLARAQIYKVSSRGRTSSVRAPVATNGLALTCQAP